jgi:hypothetical protein
MSKHTSSDIVMPLKIIHPHHTEVLGTGTVLLTVPHDQSMRRDLYTGQIVEEVALLSKSYAIIAKEEKQLLDESKKQLARSDFEQSLQVFLGEYGIKCIIAISGMGDPGIIVKVQQGESKSAEIVEIIRSGLEPESNIVAAEQSGNGFAGPVVDSPATDNSLRHPVQIIQLELGPEEREFRKEQIVNRLADIIGTINVKLGFSESNERRGGVLD